MSKQTAPSPGAESELPPSVQMFDGPSSTLFRTGLAAPAALRAPVYLALGTRNARQAAHSGHSSGVSNAAIPPQPAYLNGDSS